MTVLRHGVIQRRKKVAGLPPRQNHDAVRRLPSGTAPGDGQL